ARADSSDQPPSRRPDSDRAARLFGAAAALRAEIGAPVPMVLRETCDRALDELRAQMSEADFATAWTAGQAMTLDQAVSSALDDRLNRSTASDFQSGRTSLNARKPHEAFAPLMR